MSTEDRPGRDTDDIAARLAEAFEREQHTPRRARPQRQSGDVAIGVPGGRPDDTRGPAPGGSTADDDGLDRPTRHDGPDGANRTADDASTDGEPGPTRRSPAKKAAAKKTAARKRAGTTARGRAARGDTSATDDGTPDTEVLLAELAEHRRILEALQAGLASHDDATTTRAEQLERIEHQLARLYDAVEDLGFRFDELNQRGTLGRLLGGGSRRRGG